MTTSKNPRVLLAVKSPLQAFNAVEYCQQLRDRGDGFDLSAVVFCSPQKPDLARLIQSIIERLGSVRVQIVPNLPSEKKWWYSPKECLSANRFRRMVAKAVSGSMPPSLLLLGDYRSRECRHAAYLADNKCKIVLLDDGSATHQIARYRNNPRDPSLAPMFPGGDLRTWRLRLLAGIQLPIIRHVTFFSHYPLGRLNHDTHHAHNYEFWRQTADDRFRTPGNHILFLGMSHVEKGLATLDRYLSALRKIKAFYPHREILYRPHRDETQEKLSAVRTLGFTVLEPDVTPVELKLIQADELPGEVACIASSAMDNLAVIFEGRIALRCFVPADDYCAAGMRGHFTDIIKHHTEAGLPNMQVVHLTDLPCSP